jgi:hypothetical protein
MNTPNRSTLSLLMEELKFGNLELRANQKGVLTDSQSILLREKRSNQTAQIVVGILLWSMFSFLFVPAMIGGLGYMLARYTLLAALIAAIPVYVWIGLLIRLWIQVSADLRNCRVESIRGPVILDQRRAGKRSFVYHLIVRSEIDRMDFTVEKNIFLVFKPLETYAIYYAPNSKIILSAEPLHS